MPKKNKQSRMVVDVTTDKEMKFVKSLGKKYNKDLIGYSVFPDEVVFDGPHKLLLKIEDKIIKKNIGGKGGMKDQVRFEASITVNDALTKAGLKDIAAELKVLGAGKKSLPFTFPITNPPMPGGKGLDPEEDDDIANMMYDYGQDWPFKRTDTKSDQRKKLVKNIRALANKLEQRKIVAYNYTVGQLRKDLKKFKNNTPLGAGDNKYGFFNIKGVIKGKDAAFIELEKI